MEHLVTSDQDRAFVRRAVEAAVRIGLIAGLAVWCFAIVKPFIMPILWAVIFAVALYPVFRWLEAVLGGRRRLAAAILTLVGLAVLIVPIVVLTTSMVEGVHSITKGIEAGDRIVPPPPPAVAQWPVVGEPLADAWGEASDNLQLFYERHREQLRPVWAWVVARAAGTGAATIVFLLAIPVAGILMAKAGPAVSALTALAVRLSGDQGEHIVTNAGATIRSVVLGVLGVAAIQALVAGIGMLVVGVPAAGLWAGVVLILAIVQLPPILVLAPVAVYVFSTTSTTTGVLFLIFSVVVSGSDALLKPILLGRGLSIPMPVILIGAIGGMMLSGIVGLFVGAVVLALGYQVMLAWLEAGCENVTDAADPIPGDSFGTA